MCYRIICTLPSYQHNPARGKANSFAHGSPALVQRRGSKESSRAISSCLGLTTKEHLCVLEKGAGREAEMRVM